MSITGFKEVEQEEFNAYIKAYPNELVYDEYYVPEPPIGSYNDFSIAPKWPDSIVAYIVLEEHMKGHPVYKGEKNKFYIIG